MEEDLQWKVTFNGRGPPMEHEILRILKIEDYIQKYEKWNLSASID